MMQQTQREKITLEQAIAYSQKHDLYQRLGLSGSASGSDIAQNGKRMLALLHPDRNVNKSEGEREALTHAFKRVSEAYDTLRDPDLRARYDRKSQTSGARATKEGRERPQQRKPQSQADYATREDLQFNVRASQVVWAEQCFQSLNVPRTHQGPILAARRLFEQDIGAGASAHSYVNLVKASEILGCANRSEFGQDPLLTGLIGDVARKIWERPSMAMWAYPAFLERIKETHDPRVINDIVKGIVYEYGITLWKDVDSVALCIPAKLNFSFTGIVRSLQRCGLQINSDFARSPEIQHHIERLAKGIATGTSVRPFRFLSEANFSAFCVGLGLSTPEAMQKYYRG